MNTGDSSERPLPGASEGSGETPLPHSQESSGGKAPIPFFKRVGKLDNPKLPRRAEDSHALPSQTSEKEGSSGRGVFVTTRWTVVLMAGRSDTVRAREALARLCEAYWYPLYVYVRRRGHSPHDAQDLTQEFFARLLEHDWLSRADQAKGRFRTFLLTMMERFLANEWDKVRTLKRGGGQRFVPVQFSEAETRYGAEPVDCRTPEQDFERRWAVTLLDSVLQRLEEEFRSQGKAELFAALQPCLVGDREMLPYQDLGRQMGLSEGAVKVAVHRLRHRYRELLREEIANTVASAEEVEAEMHHLFSVLAGR